MAIIKFFYDDLWADGSLTLKTEATNFPAINTQDRDFNKPYRSRYGAGSGWGFFYAGTYNKLDFEETNGVELTAILPVSSYTPTTYAAALKTQMEAGGVGSSTYTITYSETTNKFTIASDGAGGAGILDLLWQDGSNWANSIAHPLGQTIGFNGVSEDTGSLSYEGDYTSCHSFEDITCDLGSAQAVNGVMIRGHNFQSGALVRIQASADNFTSAPVDEAMTVQDDIMTFQWDTAETYQYWRVRVFDSSNPDRYIEMGTIKLCPQFQPVNSFLIDGNTETPTDPSIRLQSAGGQIQSVQYDHFGIYKYVIITSEKSSFTSMFDEVGTSKALFLCEDPDSMLATTRYVQFISWHWSATQNPSYYRLDLEVEELR